MDTLNAEVSAQWLARTSDGAGGQVKRPSRAKIPFGKPILLCALYILLIAFTVVFSEYRNDFLVGSMCSIGVVLTASVVSVLLCWKYRQNLKSEVTDEIKRIICDYLDEMESTHKTADGPQKSKSGSSGCVLSGNPHVSIVTVYRNSSWQRVPSLLLVQGDIIALQGGDITPGQVQEILPVESAPNLSDSGHDKPSSSVEFQMRKLSEKVINKGEKIRIRKKKFNAHRSNRMRRNMPAYGRRKSRAGPMAEKQRALSSDSIELLHFSGDMRCFVLCETPVASFCRDILANDHLMAGADYTSALDLDMTSLVPKSCWAMCGFSEDLTEVSSGSSDSFLYSLVSMVYAKARTILYYLIGLLVVSTLLRFIFVSEARTQWGQVFAFPLITILMCFFPLSLPLCLIIAEILTTASLLTSIELSLRRDLAMENLSENQSREDPCPGVRTKEEGSEISGGDEFNDEDIDDRYMILYF